MSLPLISVVVITYNSTATITETLDSLANQTYRNLEIVISDDCSTDDTVKVVKEWSESLPANIKVTVVEAEKNTGIAGNCNRGVKAAQGEYIKLLAGDDCLLPQAIEKFYGAAASAQRGVVFQSKVQIIDKSGRVVEDKEYGGSYFSNNYKWLTDKSVNQYRLMLKGNFIISPAVGLLDKKLIEDCGYFDERFEMMEDYPFYLKLTAKGIRFSLIDEVLVKYRVYGESVSGGGSIRYLASVNKFFYKVRGRAMLKKFMLFRVVKEWLKCVYRKIKYKF